MEIAEDDDDDNLYMICVQFYIAVFLGYSMIGRW